MSNKNGKYLNGKIPLQRLRQGRVFKRVGHGGLEGSLWITTFRVLFSEPVPQLLIIIIFMKILFRETEKDIRCITSAPRGPRCHGASN